MKVSASDVSDDQILALLKQKESHEKGFRLLMQKYQERLYWHIRRMVNEHEDANDVIQNTFVKVYRSIHGFEGKSKLYTWLYRIATNESITFINKRKRKATSSIDNEESGVAHQLKADDYFEGDRAQLILQQALELLPEKQKTVFSLRYYDEMSYAEMSEVLDTSEGALKASYHHALKKVEQYIRDVSEEY